MSLTITIPGAVVATTGATAPATLTIGVGIPGAQGPAGAPGQGVPAGGSSGQFLQKTSGADYATDWVTLPTYATQSWVTAGFYPLTGNPSAFLVAADISGKADLASPVFTGDPRGPTPAFGDNDTSLATTAFVQAGLLGGTAVARNLEVEVRNQSGSSIPAGSIVYISGATGNKPLITLSQANNDANSAQTMGFVKTTIANNGTGYVIVRGVLDNIDTSALTEGVQLYLSPTTAGMWTTTKPYAPSHLVYVGVVIRSHPTLGTILVAVQNGYELDELHNVAAQTPSNNDLLAYESSTSLWKNKTFSALGLLTSADISGKADLAGATFTGEVSTPASTTSSAGFSILPGVAPSAPTNGEFWNTGSDLQVRLGGVTETLAEQSWVTSQGYLTSSALTPYAPLAGATFTGLVTTVAASAASAGLNIPHTATVPSAPVNGDIWTTTSGVFARINGGTTQLMNLGSTQTVSGSITFSNAAQTLGNSTAASTVNVATGATLTATIKNVNIGTGGVAGSTTITTIGPVNGASTTSIGGSTLASTLNLAHGATATATTKAVNIGTAGLAGSTTTIAVGSATSATTTTFEGTLTANGTALNLGTSTAAATYNIGTGATLTATTKAVNIGTNGVAGSTTNIAIGSTTGTSTTTLQGTTNGVTAAVDTNSVALATTAFVVGQAGSATPIVDGTAAVGTSLRYARQDHVHPTDTSRAPLASPTFTGTVTIPAGASISGFAPLASPSLTGTPLSTTAAADTNTTQIATTAFVVGQASSTAPVIDGTATVGTSLKYARADHVHPTDTSRAPLASPTFTGTVTIPAGASISGFAPLASPTFSGTPSLPTGTTAVTQTAGNNTTAVATTAFVTAAVPAFATRAQVVEPSSTTLVVSPLRLIDVVMNPGYVQIAQNNNNVVVTTSGAGASSFTTSMTRVCIGPNASTAGSSYYRPQTNGGVGQFFAKGSNAAVINFSKPFWMSGRSLYDDTFIGDANNTSRITVGKAAVGAGALSQKGIGWEKTGGSTALFKLLAHNGTSLTTVTSSTSLSSLGISGGVPFDWSVYSDGAGNVTLFINDVQVATTSAGPTGNSAGSSVWQEEIDQAVTAATRMYFTTFGGHYYHA